jgi:endoglucanase
MRCVPALATALLLLLCASPAFASGGQAPGPDEPNPLIGQTWWNQNTKYNPTWNAGYRTLLRKGRRSDARDVRLLAEQPQFRWWGTYEDRPAKPLPIEVNLRNSFQTMDQQAPGLVPLIAAFGHKGDGCGPAYLGGGAGEDARYRSFIRRFSQGVGDREVVIAFEPDAMGTVECLARSRRDDRLRTLRYGVDQLSKLTNATVYVDAGASDWQGVPTMARKLRAVGVGKVRGFMLNATHQDTTARSIGYGLKLSRRLGGKHFMVNTSHNGNGPLYRRQASIGRGTVWCNPPNAAAGTRPTTATAHPKVDAYLWVERPGYSNGACNGGPKRVGSWWTKRALQMVRRAKWYQAALRGD